MKRVISRTKEQLVSYEYRIGPHKKIRVCDVTVVVRKDGKVTSVTLCMLFEEEIDWAIELLKRIKKDFKGKWAGGIIEPTEIAELTDKERAEHKKEIERETKTQ
ncbi:MAG: hypothetical protein KKA79_06680 [Nanoarchaeota archaeon]|nr:hypothetical protein [Nanoarchaeota archaeon]